MLKKHCTILVLHLPLAAACAGTSTSKPQSTLLAEEVPVVVTTSKSGDFRVDSATELAWSTRMSVPLHYAESHSFCKSLGKGWRLPTIGELQTTMVAEGNATGMKPAWQKGLPADSVLFSSEEIPRIDDHKQPLVMRIDTGKSFAGPELEGYARCVHGPLSREQRPMAMPPQQLMAERWWENPDACPEGAVARGTAGRLIACETAEGQVLGRSTSWTPTQRLDAGYRNGNLHGTVTKWRADGLKVSEQGYRDGELDGRSTQWHDKGKKARESNYSEGKLDGTDVVWRPDGLKQSELSYRKGELHGRTMHWYENGETQSESNYANGLLHGSSKKWRLDGLEEFAATYRNGVLHGRSTVWYDNGETYSESNYVNGKLHGKALKWRADGLEESVASYRNGELHGTSTSYFDNGETASESNYANGKLHGKTVKWRRDGLKISEEAYRNGELNGTSTFYFDNGEKSSESTFADGLMSGLHQRWDAQGFLLERTVYAKARIIEHLHFDKGKPRNGQIKTQYANGVTSYSGLFRDGHAQGKHFGYHANGKRKFERNYNAKGIPSGASLDWHPTGKPREVSRFVKGALHGERRFFTKEGKPHSRFHYNQGIPVAK